MFKFTDILQERAAQRDENREGNRRFWRLCKGAKSRRIIRRICLLILIANVCVCRCWLYE